MNIDDAFTDLLKQDTDIRDHLPLLHELSRGRRVVEFGTRRGISTVSILAARPQWLITYDYEPSSDLVIIETLAREAGIHVEFKTDDIDQIWTMAQCDFVFCDAHHNGNAVAHQLYLAQHSGAIDIAIHDTEIFGMSGDLPGTPGILDAVKLFISQNPKWKIAAHYTTCYGLTHLHRS